MNQLEIEYLPSRQDLESIDMTWLSTRVQREGGFRKIAKELGIPNKRQIQIEYPHTVPPGKWNPEIAKSEITRIRNEIGIDRMPTRNEILAHENNMSLCSYISRSLGYYGYAKELGLGIKESETTTGKSCEHEIAYKLESQGHKVDQMSQNYPYDLYIDDCLKIDVKYGNMYRGQKGNFFRFSWDKKYPMCDIYVLVSGESDGHKKTIRIIPSCHVSNVSGISIGEHNSIYDVYIDRWDYIDEYLKFYSGIKESRCST